jgi:hypothetical protein
VPEAGLWNGRTLATAGGLVFHGRDNEPFRAYCADTGAELWRFTTRRCQKPWDRSRRSGMSA